MDYEKDILIDASALDVEWLEQGPLAVKYAKYAAKAASRVRRLEEEKKTVRSELILEANEDPKGTIGKDKPNAADIEAYYRNHKTYKEVIERLLEAQEDAVFAEIGKNEICFTRKKALEMLVVLHGQQYFAGPSVPRNLTELYAERNQERQKQLNQKVGKAMQRRTTLNEKD
jgi:hypothetical protein